jgi:hypothetical protein
MAFYDFLFGGGEAAQLKKHGRRMADRDAQAEDRDASARWLADNGSDDALHGLFNRFNLQLEHTLKDQKEKDFVLELLAEHGARACAVARAFARHSTSFQYPVRLLDKVEGSESGTELLISLLAEEKLENEFKPEKKRNLLIFLAERRDPRIAGAAERFLEDFSEGVRHAAIEAIAAQEGDGGRVPLFRALCRQDEESTRVRGRLAEIFATRGWDLPDVDPWLLEQIPSGFRISGARLVAGR